MAHVLFVKSNPANAESFPAQGVLTVVVVFEASKGVTLTV